MNLLSRLLLFVFLGSASLLPQVVQLGVKGRTREAGPPRASPATANPVHRLPRRIAMEDIVIPPNEQDLERERMRAASPPPRLLPEDRVRPLVRRRPAATPPSPLPAIAAAPRDPPPRRLTADGSLAGFLPSFEIPPGSEPRAEAECPTVGSFGFPVGAATRIATSTLCTPIRAALIRSARTR